MIRGSLRFYFDYISSNAYLAWTQLPELAEKHGFSDPLEPAVWEKWLTPLRPSAVRRRFRSPSER